MGLPVSQCCKETRTQRVREEEQALPAAEQQAEQRPGVLVPRTQSPTPRGDAQRAGHVVWHPQRLHHARETLTLRKQSKQDS